MKSLIKAGRFAFLLPYLIIPFVLGLTYSENLSEALTYTVFMPLGIESPVIILFPVCWIISAVCFVLCFSENRKNGDAQAQKRNLALLIFTAVLAVIHIIAVIAFGSNFQIHF